MKNFLLVYKDFDNNMFIIYYRSFIKEFLLELNNYFDYNIEIEDFYDDVQKATYLTYNEIIRYVSRMSFDEPLTYRNLEEVYAFAIHEYFNRNDDHGIAYYVGKFDIDKNGNVRA